MNIALCHFRVGETDGVSLEMEKWKNELIKLGNSVCFLAGSTGTAEGYIIPELHYKSEENNCFVYNAYVDLKVFDNDGLKESVFEYASRIEAGIEKFVRENSIDVLVPNNIWSLGWGLPAGIAFANAVKKLGIKCVAHHHDFYWERVKYSNPTCQFVNSALLEYFPPDSPLIKHCVINNIAKGELKRRRGIDAVVVPNVFDFKADQWKIDDYNCDFRQKLGVDENDIVILQGTRISERKAIELAIDVIGKIIAPERLEKIACRGLYDGRSFSKKNRVVFVMAGLPESEEGYIEKLNEKAAGYGVEIIYANKYIKHSRRQSDDEKYYSLWDAYAHADLVTYPSILEGWGNQFLEAVFAKKPIIVYEYPVYVTDIKQKGFDVISLGAEHTVDNNGLVCVDEKIIESAADSAVEVLTDITIRKQIVEKNFNICKENFSYESLSEILSEIFNSI